MRQFVFNTRIDVTLVFEHYRVTELFHCVLSCADAESGRRKGPPLQTSPNLKSSSPRQEFCHLLHFESSHILSSVYLSRFSAHWWPLKRRSCNYLLTAQQHSGFKEKFPVELLILIIRGILLDFVSQQWNYFKCLGNSSWKVHAFYASSSSNPVIITLKGIVKNMDRSL